MFERVLTRGFRKENTSYAGRSGFDPLLMFKVPILHSRSRHIYAFPRLDAGKQRPG